MGTRKKTVGGSEYIRKPTGLEGLEAEAQLWILWMSWTFSSEMR